MVNAIPFPEPGDPHFFALIVPVPAEKHKSARNRRRREARLLDKARKIRIDGMTLDEFGKLPTTAQFLHLREFVPAGWRPVDFKEAKAEHGIDRADPKAQAIHAGGAETRPDGETGAQEDQRQDRQDPVEDQQVAPLNGESVT